MRLTRNNSGLGIVETLVAGGLLTITALTFSIIIISAHNAGHLGEAGQACQQRATSVLNLFKNHDNKLNVSNFVPFMNGATSVQSPTFPYSSGQTYTQDGITLFPNGCFPPTGAGCLRDSQDDQVNSWMLIDSAANWARILYNVPGSYCTGAQGSQIYSAASGGGVAPFNAAGPLAVPNNPINNTENIYLKIIPFDFTNNKTLACGSPYHPVPLGANNHVNYAAPVGFDNQGLQLTATVAYTGANGILQSCSAQTNLGPEGDPVPIYYINVPGTGVDPDPTHCSAVSPGPCLCQSYSPLALEAVCVASPCAGGAECGVPQAGFRSIAGVVGAAPAPPYSMNICTTTGKADVVISTNVSESATLFTCELDYNLIQSPTNTIQNMASCQQFTDTAGLGLVGQTVDTENNYQSSPSGLKMQINQAPIGFYKLSVIAVDSAQNATRNNVYFQVYTNGGACP